MRSVRCQCSWKRFCLSVCVSDTKVWHKPLPRRLRRDSPWEQSCDSAVTSAQPREGPAVGTAALPSLAHPCFGSPALLAQPWLGLCL